MDSLIRLPGIKRMNRVSNARIRELCGVVKIRDKRMSGSILRRFGHIQNWRMIGLLKRCIWESV